MNTYTVHRNRILLWIGYCLAEGVLIAILAAMLVIWRDAPAYLDWPVAAASWVAVALLFHFLLFPATFHRVRISGETIECHAFLRKTKTLHFSDIHNIRRTGDVEVTFIGAKEKKLFYVRETDKNFDRFMRDVSAYTRDSISD